MFTLHFKLVLSPPPFNVGKGESNSWRQMKTLLGGGGEKKRLRGRMCPTILKGVSVPTFSSLPVVDLAGAPNNLCKNVQNMTKLIQGKNCWC